MFLFTLICSYMQTILEHQCITIGMPTRSPMYMSMYVCSSMDLCGEPSMLLQTYFLSQLPLGHWAPYTHRIF